MISIVMCFIIDLLCFVSAYYFSWMCKYFLNELNELNLSNNKQLILISSATDLAIFSFILYFICLLAGSTIIGLIFVKLLFF